MNKDSLRSEVEADRRHLRDALVAYYGDGEPLCSDAEYDALAARVAEREAKEPHLRDWDSPTTVVRPPPQDPFPTREHRTPMRSLANVYSIEELREWEASLLRLLPDAQPVYLTELKVDGLAIALVYERGRLASAVTRGDGTMGEEVTRNIKTVRRLPHRLPEPLDLEVRGEVYYDLADFRNVNEARERLGEQPFKNPRNAAAGTLRTLDTTQVGERRLNVAIYALASESPHATDSETLAWLGKLGLPISAPLHRYESLDAVAELYEQTLERRHRLDFQIDGLVVKVDQLDLRERAGFTSKSPRWAVALKFGAEQAETTLEDVGIGVGRTGVLTPVAHLTPVLLAGTTVSRATLHNYDQIARLDLQIGDRVILEKGGDIIPKVVSVVLDARKHGSRRPIESPAECPSCRSQPVRLEGEVDWHCVNPACPEQRAERIRHFVSRGAMDIESVGPALIDQLLERGWVETYADLYELTAEKLEQLERMGKKSAANVMRAIEQSKHRPLDKFLNGLGIRYVGERTARVLARHFGGIEALEAASVEDFENVSEIGAVTAKSLHTFFHDPQQLALVHRCLELGVQPEPLEQGSGPMPLAGRTVVITGTLSAPRTQWKERLERAGASVTGSVSAKTDYLLVGESPGSKLDAANKHGVTVLDETQMTELLEQA